MFLCIFGVAFMFPNVSKKNNKKMDRGVGLWGLTNPSFSRIKKKKLT